MVDQMAEQVAENEEALPQILGEFAPIDVWQQHMNAVFYGLRGERLRELYQTVAAADYRLGYALAADYVDRATRRPKAGPETGAAPLTIMEWGCGNGNLAACFLDQVKALDRDATLYPRLQYVLIDASETVLASARANAELANHRDRVQFVHATGAGTAIVSRRVDRSNFLQRTVERIADQTPAAQGRGRHGRTHPAN